MISAVIRLATAADAPAIAALFHDTVRRVNARDYAAAQVEAWAGAAPDPARWLARLEGRFTWVEEENGVILGFIALEADGHVDTLYVHADHQRRGVAGRLLRRLEDEARARGLATLRTEASITAQAFFAAQGFRTIAAQDVEHRGSVFRNYRMEKPLG